jgi:hypothetical protein
LLLIIHPVRGALQVSRFNVVPLLTEIQLSRIRLFNQSYLFLSSPAFELFLARNGLTDVLVDFKPHKSVTVVTLGKTFVFFPLVLEDALADPL